MPRHDKIELFERNKAIAVDVQKFEGCLDHVLRQDLVMIHKSSAKLAELHLVVTLSKVHQFEYVVRMMLVLCQLKLLNSFHKLGPRELVVKVLIYLLEHEAQVLLVFVRNEAAGDELHDYALSLRLFLELADVVDGTESFVLLAVIVDEAAGVVSEPFVFQSFHNVPSSDGVFV